MMRKTIFLVVLVLLLAACLTTVSFQKKEMVYRYNNGAEPQNLDPAKMTGHPEHSIALQMFEGLFTYNPETLAPVPGCADRFTVSPDGITYVFYLKKGLVWSDGTPINAETFRYSWLRVLNPATAAEYAYQLWYIKNGENFTNGKAKESEVGIKVIDPFTLQVTLERPCAYFMSLIPFPTYMPVPKQVIDKVGEDRWYLKDNIVCNGPFKLVEWLPSDHITLVKNDRYWDKSKVKLDKVIIYANEDNNTSLAQFLNDELEYQESVPTERIDEMKTKPFYHAVPYLGTYYYMVNVDPVKQTNKALLDKNVRKALYLTINRKYLIDNILRAGQVPAYSLVPPNMPGYQGFTAGKENVEEAKKLLAAAGFSNPKNFPKFTITYNTSEAHKKIAEAIQQMWKQVLGISVDIENTEWKVYLDRTTALDYQVARRGWIGDYIDPNTFIDMFVTNGGNNKTGWSNKDYDLLVDQASKELNTQKRMSIFYNAEKMLMNDFPILPIYHYVNVYTLQVYVKGVYGNILNFHPLKEVYLSK